MLHKKILSILTALLMLSSAACTSLGEQPNMVDYSYIPQSHNQTIVTDMDLEYF